MSNESLASWKTDTAIVLLDTLPLQTLDSATVLVENYLSSTGGWIPDDPADPLGPGVPATGETPPEAAVSITNEQLERIYNIRVTANLDLNLALLQNLDPGLTDEDVSVLIEETVENFIANQLGCTLMELNEMFSFTSTIKRGGETTTEQRQEAQTNIESGDKLIDPISISLSIAKQRFDLDDFWNVAYIYNEPGQDIVSSVQRYTDTTYETLDTSTDVQQIVTIDATDYELATGVTKN